MTRRRVLLRGVLGAALVAAVVLTTAAPAFAHAVLEGTSPADGTSYSAGSPPRVASMHWGENVGIKLGAVRVYDDRGSLVKTGPPIHPNNDGSTVSVTLPELAPGTYLVSWRVISADTHPVSGAFTFTVGNHRTDVSKLATRVLSSANGSRSVGVLYGIDRFGIFASLTALLGGSAFIALVWPTGRRSRRASRILWIALAAGVVISLIGFAIEGIYAAAFPLRELFDSTVLNDTLHARYGETALARAAILVLLGIPLLRVLFSPRDADAIPPRRPPGWWYAAGFIAAEATIMTITLASHGTTGRWTGLAIPDDMLHVSAVALWFGGLLMLTAAMLPAADTDSLVLALPRYSNLATGAVIVIFVSGLFQAIRQVGTFHALESTSYGHILIAKIVAFGALLLVAVFSREIVDRVYEPQRLSRRLTARLAATNGAPNVITEPEPEEETVLGNSRALRHVQRTVRIEVVIAVVVLTLTALLVDARPAYEVTNGPQVFTMKTAADQPPVVWFNVVIEPATRGLNQIHLTTETPEGGTANPLSVTMELGNTKRNIGPLLVTLARIGPGHYIANDDIPFAGTWSLTIKALMNQIDESSATRSVTIR